MFGRKNPSEAPTITYMKPELITPVEGIEEVYPDDEFLVKAVLFGTGETRRLARKIDVYGLVLAGYQGLKFGDDGSFTGMLVSELPLDASGIRRVEGVMNEAVMQARPEYCAEFVGYIAVDEAAAMLGALVKLEHGVALPHDAVWSTGRHTFTS